LKVKTELEFGQRYQDRHSGYEGTLVAVSFYDNGCTRALLVSGKLKPDGEPQEVWFDEGHILPKEKVLARTGGPMHDAPGR
jgi:hypothetical protein